MDSFTFYYLRKTNKQKKTSLSRDPGKELFLKNKVTEMKDQGENEYGSVLYS